MKEYNLLIVDDDKVTIQAIREKLGSSSYKFILHEACDGESAIKFLNENDNIDCILLDYILPDYNGLELLCHFKKLDIVNPVIILTSEGDETLAVNALKAGAYDYINKLTLGRNGIADILPLAIINAIKEHQIEVEKAIARLALELSEERYRGLIENSPILIMRVFPDDNTISFANDGFCEYFKVQRFEIIGENIFDFIPEEKRSTLIEKVKSISKKDEIINFELEITIENEKKWQKWTYQAIFDEAGNIIEYQGMGKDITDLKEAERKVTEQKLFLQSILDAQENMIIVANKNQIIVANNSFKEFFGFNEFRIEDNNYQKMFDLLVEVDGYMNKPKEKEGLQTLYRTAVDQKLVAFQPENFETPKIFSVFLSKMSINEETYVVEFLNITEFEEKYKEVEDKASHDPLTKIFNRRKFDETLNHFVNVSKRYKNDLSMIYFDIDHFKKINDSFGHQAGDSVLIELSELVQSKIRDADIFARWGGEEFAILSPETNFDNTIQAAEKIRKEIKNFEFKHVKSVTCSFGVTHLKEKDDIDSFIKRVDKALYQAKETGRNKVVGVRKK